MEFRILGPLEVAEGARQLQVGGTRERALLAILLIHAGEVVSADRLIEELWGSGLPGNPSNALQVVVSRVRKALEGSASPSRLVTRKPGYVLDVRPDELDAGRFGRLVEEARRTGPADQPRGLSLLQEALGLWRGPALAEFAAQGFAREEIARLEEERTRAVEMKAEAELALGRHAELVGELRVLVAANPLRERLRGHLMLALYRSGRQGEALRVFQEGRSVLVDELGVDPGPELQELHQQILLQAASLIVAPEAGAAPKGNLPAPVTSFVGRDAELAAAGKLLRRSRLVTLTGPGGSGKTRLAVELARNSLESFPDGAWLVELEAVSDPAMVPASLAAALGIGESACALAYFWLIGRRRSEVRQRLAEAVGIARGASPANRAKALIWAALLADVEGRADEAATQAREAYELSKDAGDPWWLALCEAILGLALGLHGQVRQAGELLEAGRARFGKAGDGWGAAIATMLLGYVSAVTADRDRATALARESLEGFRAAGDQWGQTMALELLGLLARHRGAFDEAISAYEEALGVVRDPAHRAPDGCSPGCPRAGGAGLRGRRAAATAQGRRARGGCAVTAQPHWNAATRSGTSRRPTGGRRGR
jgi:DNA-binding SARP family transcriptional activator